MLTDSHAASLSVPVSGRRLVIEGLVVHRQGSPVVNGVDLELSARELVALLGANGAGKSTLLAAISGVVPVVSGRILVDDVDISSMGTEERARLISHVPEGRHLFGSQTVRENLVLGAVGASRKEVDQRLQRVFDVFPPLATVAKRPAGRLSGGQQQMVALGRGLMSGAPVLLIDELSLGLAPKVATNFASALGKLRDEGYAVLLVEQYVSLAMSIADRVAVLARGRIALQGSVEEARRDPGRLRRSYLGDEEQRPSPMVPELVGAATVSETAVDTVDGPSPKSLRRRLGDLPGTDQPLLIALAGAVVLGVSCLMPWFSYSNVLGGSGHLFVWDIPLPWSLAPWLTALTLTVVIAIFFSPSRRRVLVPCLATLAAAVLALVVARTWLFASGLAARNRTYTRSWGLLVALHGVAGITLGTVRLVRGQITLRGAR